MTFTDTELLDFAEKLPMVERFGGADWNASTEPKGDGSRYSFRGPTLRKVLDIALTDHLREKITDTERLDFLLQGCWLERHGGFGRGADYQSREDIDRHIMEEKD